MNARIPCALALFFCPLVNAGTVGLTQGNPVEPAIAGVSVPTDGTWIVLDELMTVGSFYAPLFTYTSPDPLQLDVTDLFVVSDQNEVYLDGVLLGATPPMPDWPALFPPVGPMDDAPFTSDPDVAWARPQFSKQSFAVPAGTHMLTFRNIHIPPTEESVPFADGTVAFRLVPEPSTGLLLLIAAAAVGVCGGRRLPRAMRVARGRAPTLGALTAAMVAALAAPRLAVATPCGPLDVDVVSNVLEVQGTAGVDDLRIRKNGFLIEVYSPASAGTPSCSYDYIATPFGTIRVQTFGDDDTIVVDDSGGALSDTFILELDGGDGADIVLAGIDLNAIPLASAMTMISSLQQASLLVDRALDLLDAPASGCGSASTLVANAAGVVKDAGEDVVMPTAAYVRDIESTLVQPSAQAVRKARDRIAGYLQTFVATDVLAAAAEAEAFAADVEVHVGDFELLLPMGQALLSRAQTLYAHASSMGLETQSGDAITVFQQTVEAHIQTIITLAELCDEDPEPTETEFNEDLQDPSGLPPLCAEVERRIEALEALIDSVEASIDAVEVEGDQFEVDGDALEVAGENLGDDELPTSAAFQIEQDGAAIETTGDGISMTADALNADWEQWVAQKEADLEAAGGTMDARGQAEVLGAANALHAQAAADVEACAAALRAEADLIVADLQALLVFAAPLLRDDLSNFGADPTCPVTANNTVNGGPGADILIGSTGSDLIDGGDGTDLIVGAGGADRLRGGDGNDLIFGGGGNDEIFGGPKVDVLVGNKGNDCIFGGGGQTLTRGSLSVQLGDLFFGLDDNDFLVSGDSTADTLTEIDVAFGNDGDDRIRLSHGGTLTVGSFSLQFGNLAFGGAGDDDILTADGIDVIFGGDDDDTIATAKGAQLTIGTGSSQFRLALGDLIFGGAGADAIDSDDDGADAADQDIDVVFGQDGNDTINGYNGGLLSVGDASNPDFELLLGNLIFGGNQDDEITTLDGIDVIFGGNENDTVTTGKGALLTIGSGSNEFRLALGDLIFGGDGDDTLHGDDPAADRADDDIDVIFGGAGVDTISGYNGGLLSIGDASDPDFEFMLGTVIFGGSEDDEIETLDGVDVIFCGAGNDEA
ncbi:MAG: PEP-CTERM sorting domain-containing protein, partial [Phycisphaerae bacterium]